MLHYTFTAAIQNKYLYFNMYALFFSDLPTGGIWDLCSELFITEDQEMCVKKQKMRDTFEALDPNTLTTKDQIEQILVSENIIEAS